MKFTALPLLLLVLACTNKRDIEFESKIKDIQLKYGDIALCGQQEFGLVDFNISCEEKVRNKFNLATALLHSFEYEDAEKVFAKVIDEDPECVMAYWGVAMSNFHALWAMNEKLDLEKGAKTIALARSLENKTQKESDYLEAIGAYYDDWKSLDHKTRSLRFEQSMEKLYNKYPEEKEAAIFYALALNANANPADKTYQKQKRAGEILNKIYLKFPNHPGIAHYIIHTYDYPELALLGLPAAKRYASIAPASAHAQHMPSHIFTRLGYWEDAIKSNLKSVEAAKCYSSNAGIKGIWDEQLHGMDYLTYAYLQKGDDAKAKDFLNIINSLDTVSHANGKSAYVLAAIPARYAVERKQWQEAASLVSRPDFPWEKFPWENALTHFSKLLGLVQTGKTEDASKELDILKNLQRQLVDKGETYKANQVGIQITAGEAWIALSKGENEKAEKLMITAAETEEATGKHPVTPGEIVPARELLGDLYMNMGNYEKALQTYEESIKTHPSRLNGLIGTLNAAKKVKDAKKADLYLGQLRELTAGVNTERQELKATVDL